MLIFFTVRNKMFIFVIQNDKPPIGFLYSKIRVVVAIYIIKAL